MAVDVASDQAVDPAPGCLTSNLGWLLSQADHHLLAENQAALAPLGLGSRGYCVLSTAQAGRYTQSELAELVGVDKTTMVVTVDELERLGLARRVPSPNDRRVRLIEVTTAGARAVTKAAKIIDQVQEEVLSVLSEDERRILLCALTQLVKGPLSESVECSPPVRRREPRAA
jgi:DNA-binding MarR family transcriptional regulator